MKELTNQFIEYINTGSPLSSVHEKYKYIFETIFVMKLVEESKKCLTVEGEKDLMLNAALALIDEHREDFDKYKKEKNKCYYFQWRHQDTKQLAIELVEYIRLNQIFKLLVKNWLRDERKNTFEEERYKEYLNNFLIEDHPMQTFVYWLNYIEHLRGTIEYKNWLVVKQNLINWMRVGNATLPRCEWRATGKKIEE